MERQTRHKIATGTSAEDFCLAHPVDSPGFNAALDGLKQSLAEANTLQIQQREGIILEVSGGATRRNVLDQIWTVHLPHLAYAARRAEREQPELIRKFLRKPASNSISARRAAAASMVEAAESSRDVLVKHGMDESVLADLVRLLAEVDTAADQCIAGRAAHVGATARLRAVGQEIVELVRVLDGLNRVRFKDDEALLAQWASMSSVRPTPKGSSADGTAAVPGSESRAAASQGDAARPAA